MIDVEKVRVDLHHYGKKLFLNNAGASLMPHVVVEEIQRYLDLEERYGGYKTAELEQENIADYYSQTAKLLNCSSHNIAFAHDATDAYAKALSSIPFQHGDVIVTTDDDYTSNQIQFISLGKRFGVRIERIRTDNKGDLDIEHFRELVERHSPRLVAVTHVPNNSGLIQDVTEVGNICHEKDILYLVDACQSVGQLAVDVLKIKCDFMSATGRKFLRGPRGTGILYVSDKALGKGYAPMLIDGGGAIWTGEGQFEIQKSAQRFQGWEAPYALINGFRTALRYANDVGIENIQSYNKELMSRLRGNLSQIPGVTMHDKGSNTCAILTFRKKGKSLEHVKATLERHEVYFSVSVRNWGLIDFDKKGIDWAIRLSPHYFNTFAEMDRLAEIVEGI